MQDLVSIIVPVYNMGDKLEKSIQSLLAQTYGNIEIILVNDGSKDNSGEVCDKLAKQDGRIAVIHTQNRGSGPARNTGIAASKGSYLYFPDADDYLEPNAIEKMLCATENGKYDLVVFGYKNCKSSDEIISQRVYTEQTFTGDEIRGDYADFLAMDRKWSIQGAPWNKFFCGGIVRKYGIEYPPLRRHQDECFIARYMCYCRNVHFIGDILYTYYPNTVSLEWNKYPVDYMDCVVGVHKIFGETIGRWSTNEAVHHTLEERYLSNIIKALELSYAPKMQLNIRTRRTWLKKQVEAIGLARIGLNTAGSLYQKLILLSAKLKCYEVLALLLYAGTIKRKKQKG